MTNRIICLPLVAFSLLVATSHITFASNVVPDNFNGAGSVVNGYQSFFTSTSFNGWTQIAGGSAQPANQSPISNGDFTLPGDGTLHVNSGSGDPNKLLYSGASYDNTNQNILAEIRVTNAGGGGDGDRGGVAGVSSPTDGSGINVLFRDPGDNGAGNHLNFLNDHIAWGPNTASGTWTTGTYLWVREVTTATGETATIWPADGHTPEPSTPTLTWNATGRVGLAGIVSNSGGSAQFQVNYFLLQAAGLPQITAVPEPSTFILGSLGLVALLVAARRRKA